MPKFFIISSCTFGVAVAVSAIMGILSPIRPIICFKFLYSGLKSWPHSLIQCASSIAIKDTFTERKNSTFSSLVSDSGATYKSFVMPFTISSFTRFTSVLFNEEFKTWAIPSSFEIPRMASTWFFIKAIKGDTTMAVPSCMSAGNW